MVLIFRLDLFFIEDHCIVNNSCDANYEHTLRILFDHYLVRPLPVGLQIRNVQTLNLNVGRFSLIILDMMDSVGLIPN